MFLLWLPAAACCVPAAVCLLLCCLQGTTCVFSKKVEYLHNLVYQALETIFNKRSQAKQAAAGSGGAGKVGGGVQLSTGGDGVPTYAAELASSRSPPGQCTEQQVLVCINSSRCSRKQPTCMSLGGTTCAC
jgi:hypothetical protein